MLLKRLALSTSALILLSAGIALADGKTEAPAVPTDYAGIAKCLTDKGFTEGTDFRKNPKYGDRVQRHTGHIDARGRLDAWVVARKACGLTPLES